MSHNEYTLSKTRYLAGQQCAKLLWMHYHQKEAFPPIDAATQAIFDQGHAVGELAQTLFPGGVAIRPGTDFEAIIRETKALLPKRVPLFEAGFSCKNTYARADILNPCEDDQWDLIEVKSGTNVKDEHIADLAFQKYCYEGAGLKIRNTHLMHINNGYVKKGAIDPRELFHQEDVTGLVNQACPGVEEEIERLLKTLRENECPEVAIGMHCEKPYECALKPICFAHLPEHNVLTFDHMRKETAFGLIDAGILDIKDVPPETALSGHQAIQKEAYCSGKVCVNTEAIEAFLQALELPLYFLDFETVGPAIPVYDNSRPYQQVPFQYSLHILTSWDAEPEHHAFLAEGTQDPRPALLEGLKRLLGTSGTILAYNMSFELCRLRESVEVWSGFTDWFKNNIEPRFKDLIVPFRKFDYYDPGQKGKTSIKKVYPAMTGESYEGLGIGDGGTASREYARVTFGTDITAEDRECVRNDLLKYCALDTMAMIRVLERLRATCGSI
ncbi:MAG: DUF2779 domain-containing protein [Desulfobacterales bacterium]|nr:DUF2779 domain-containing protein [Desulfobacterales bacterium]